jgi:uncharacterized membrane protein
MEFIKQFLTAGVIMGVFDAVWLTTMSKFYRSHIGQIMLDKPNFTAAIIFYVIYVVGIVVFVLSPALEKNSWEHALGYGALFGFVAYATYDLTNLATLKGFSPTLVIVDLIWGAFLTGSVAVLSYFAIKAWLQ